MSDFEFNVAKGRTVELHHRVVSNDPANAALVVVLLKASETDATLKDYDTLGAILAAAGNTEADFTNYARKTLTDAELSDFTTDDTNDRNTVDFPDQTWNSAGGTTNNTLTKLLVCYDSDSTAGDDTNIVPLMAYDFAKTTGGKDLPAIPDSEGYYAAT